MFLEKNMFYIYNRRGLVLIVVQHCMPILNFYHFAESFRANTDVVVLCRLFFASSFLIIPPPPPSDCSCTLTYAHTHTLYKIQGLSKMLGPYVRPTPNL
jgi:hypothetical protein